MALTHDITKLPKWVQDSIATLERQVSDQQKIIDESKGIIENPVLFKRTWGYSRNTQPVASEGSLLHLMDGEDTLATIKFNAAERVIEINSWGELFVKPHAGNVVEVNIPERH